MALTQDERVQEWFLLLGDKLAPVKKIWWYVLLATVILAVPVYYLTKLIFVKTLSASYTGPAIIYTAPVKEPLQILDKKIFTYAGNNYGGFVKIKNINLEWGVASQEYKVDFRTFGGTSVGSVDRSTFILPASEKLIVIPRFLSDKKPDEITVTLGETHFIHTSGITINSDLQRTSFQNPATGATVNSAFINLSAFAIGRVDLTVAIFNAQNEIVGVNYTNINDVKAAETRTFQLTWPEPIASAVRTEVYPEINIFDRNILSAPTGVSPFDQTSQ